jgi:Fic family protein
MEMFRLGRMPADKSEQMIFNNLQGMEFIRAHQGDELTPELVKAIHVEMMSDTIPDEDLGRLQTADEKRVHVASNRDQVILHEPLPVEQLPLKLKAMCGFSNRRNEKDSRHLAQSFNPVCEILSLHIIRR